MGEVDTTTRRPTLTMCTVRPGVSADGHAVHSRGPITITTSASPYVHAPTDGQAPRRPRLARRQRRRRPLAARRRYHCHLRNAL